MSDRLKDLELELRDVIVALKDVAGVTANLFRSANLFRRNLFASGSVPDFQKISEFVPDGQRSMIL